jgi:hypothetical protein
MPKVPKPIKKSMNRPTEFHESLAQALPQVPEMQKFSERQIRLGMYVAWGAATLIAGSAIGLLINRSQGLQAVSVAPSPVAQTTVSVTSVPAETLLSVVSPQTQNSLTVAPSSSVNQAQAGSLLTTAPLSDYQAAQNPNALDPGFINYGSVQGNIGTSAVE